MTHIERAFLLGLALYAALCGATLWGMHLGDERAARRAHVDGGQP
jgi:hypothetical protein